MKKLLLSSIFIFGVFHSIAQEQHTDDFCSTVTMMEKAIADDPSILDRNAKREIAFQNFLEKRRQQKSAVDDPDFIIPVVIHIIHDYAESNISDEQVQDAMRVINEDFNMDNEDVSEIIPEFEDIIGNIGVEFRLATIDPDGNCTRGVTRTFSNLTHEAGENVKDLIKWDPDKYVNVWIVQTVGSGAGGYSYYPGNAPGNDANAGIVLRNAQFGSIGTSNSGDGAARSFTHEMGHYLDLPHVWGNSNSPAESGNCGTDDGIDDTPNTLGSTSCDLYAETCGSLDLAQNYMGYTGCAKMFTEGQKERMIFALEEGYEWWAVGGAAPRDNLWQEANLLATGTSDNTEPQECEVLVDFQPSTKSACTDYEVNFDNLSYNYIEVDEWNWSFPGGSPSSSDQEHPSVSYASPGWYTVTLNASNTAGTQTLTKEELIFVSSSDATLSAPILESIEDSSFPNVSSDMNHNWSISTPGGTGETWERSTAAASAGDASIRIRSYNFENNTDKHVIYSPNLDFSDVNTPAKIKFKIAHVRRNPGSEDRFEVSLSRNCGANWSRRFNKTTDDLVTVSGNQFTDFVPSDSEWEEYEINVNSWAGDENVKVKFEFSGDGGNYFYLDEIIFPGDGLSIDENPLENMDMTLYPNPSDGNATLEFAVDNNTDMQIRVQNIVGKEIANVKQQYQTGRHSIQLSELCGTLESGIYLIQVESQGFSRTEKLVISN